MADLTRLPFPDGSFDCVTCGYVLEHLPDAKLGLGELSRVMMPGARMLLLTTEDNFSGAWTSRFWCCRTYNRRELARICEGIGLAWHQELWFTAHAQGAAGRRHLRGTGQGLSRLLPMLILQLSCRGTAGPRRAGDWSIFRPPGAFGRQTDGRKHGPVPYLAPGHGRWRATLKNFPLFLRLGWFSLLTIRASETIVFEKAADRALGQPASR